MSSRLLIRREGSFESIKPLLSRLRLRRPGVSLEVEHHDTTPRIAGADAPAAWCADHGISYRAVDLAPSGRDLRPSVELRVDDPSGGAALRFVPDPYGPAFDAAVEARLARGRAPLTIWIAEDGIPGARAAGSSTMSVEPDDTPVSLKIKLRAATRDLVEALFDGQPRPSGLVPRDAEAGPGPAPPPRPEISDAAPVSISRLGRNLLARAALSCGVVQLRDRLQRRAGTVPGAIVNFHRVADDGRGHWMTLSTDDFSRYVDFLTRSYVVVSLAELRRRLATGRNVEPLVAITFDDGYRECLTAASPVLEEFGCPASFYVCSRFFDEDGDFAHDAARGQLGLKKLRGSDTRRLHELGFEIGSHSHSHMDFRTASEHAIATELSVSRGRIAAAIDADVRGLAVPFGSRSHCRPEVFAAARRSGYEYVLSHFDGRNRPGAAGFHLLRVRPNLEGLASLHAAVAGWRGLSGLFSAAPDPRIPGAEEGGA